MERSLLRVATLNLFGVQGDWERRRPVLREGLAALAPDVIAFQEAVVTSDYDQVRDVLGDAYHVHHQAGRSADGYGASIAARSPFLQVEEHHLPRSPRMNPAHPWVGSVAMATIAGPGAIGTVGVAHVKPTWQRGFEREREDQAVAAAMLVEQRLVPRAEHVIVLGDFDATPTAASMRFWRGEQSLEGKSVCYQDAWEACHPGAPGHTFTNQNALVAAGEMPLDRGRRIDYILLRCTDHGPTLDVRRAERTFAQPVNGTWASDHFGLVADFADPAMEQSTVLEPATPG